MERVKGIEPSYSAWEAAALPLSYTRDLSAIRPSQTCRQAGLAIHHGKVSATSPRSPAFTVTVASTGVPSLRVATTR